MTENPAMVTADDEARRFAEAWVARPALAELVTRFGGPARDGRSAESWLAELEPFTQRWDFRHGRERDLARVESFGADDAAAILEAAGGLGMRGTGAPSADRYDAVIILGGLVRACFSRPLFAAELLRAGTISTSRVIGLGGHRELSDAEETLSREITGAVFDDEFDAMDAGVRSVFALGDPVGVAGVSSDDMRLAWSRRDYVTPVDATPVHVIAAPSTSATKRANTLDTYQWLATRGKMIGPGSRILIVTTRIYQPFQEADAWRSLRLEHGVLVEVLGIEPGDADPRLAQEFGPQQYLQETRSAIRAMLSLLSATRYGG